MTTLLPQTASRCGRMASGDRMVTLPS
jgi:hypothetical protein